MAISQVNLIQECSDLFSNHYGYYSSKSDRSPRENIKLSPGRIKKWLELNKSFLFYAKFDGKLIGYAIVSLGKVKNYGNIAWVTQLVVHEDFRNKGIGKNLLFTIWKMSDYFSWGLLTSSPYAIRALEKATRRRCIPLRIKKNVKMLFNYGKSNVEYINEDTPFKVTNEQSVVDTHFFTDRTCIKEMISDVISEGNPWLLGNLEEGWEWIAFTFKDQEQIGLTPSEIEDMLAASDKITKLAYSRMLFDENHLWARHAPKEVDVIVEKCGLGKNLSIIDIGCGNGRHSIEFAKKKYDVVGVDYNSNLIDKARIKSKSFGLNIEFIVDDCRSVRLDRKFDVVLCLYDVIGSYVDNDENFKILNTVKFHLNKGGHAIISVMNYELTENKAINFFDIEKEPNKLLEIPPSKIMESTGDIFNPEFYAIETKSKIIYRKEQFTKGLDIPGEYIVRDRRFTMDEIKEMCLNVGLDVISSSYVSAGKWDQPLTSTHEKAKEILLICRMP